MYKCDFEFVIPGEAEIYVDLIIDLSVREVLVERDRSTPDAAESTTVVSHLLHSLVSQCSVTVNGISRPPRISTKMAYLETVLT